MTTGSGGRGAGTLGMMAATAAIGAAGFLGCKAETAGGRAAVGMR
jgi:hypothetical protein